MSSPVNALVAFALRQRLLMVVLLAALIGAGTLAFLRLNIEAYPDPVPPLVDIVTQSSGMSAEEIERYITIPIEIHMAGIPHVKAIRTISLFGLSDVKLQFSYDLTYQEAQQWVINRLSELPPLPGGAQPSVSPWSPIGEIYRYRVVGPPGTSVTDLRTIATWILERRLKAVPGVVDVNTWGGKSKTFEVEIDQGRLAANGLTLAQVLTALGNANANVGGQTITLGEQSAVVRGVGLIHSAQDIEETVIVATAGAPVLIRDVARVTVGHLPRLGIAGIDDDDDIVEGIVLMHRGEKSRPAIDAVTAEVARINDSGLLPPGVKIERIYDRSSLIDVTTRTVIENMLSGIVLVFLVQWIFLGDFRSAVIVAATIPFALFFAILIMMARGESANLLSVGAIDFGLIVDSTVIMVENIFRHLAENRHDRYQEGSRLHRMRTLAGFPGKLGVIMNSATEVNRSIFFSAAIIVAGFLPLFTLSGVEGHIFGPMAKTYAYAIAGGLIATFAVAPALSALLFPEAVEERETLVVRGLRRAYEPLVGWALAHRWMTLGGIAALSLLALVAAGRLGLEFLPHLEEGNLWIRATMPLSVSLETGNDRVNAMRRLIKSFPEVQTVVSQDGRPDDGTDATGFFNAEFFVPLKPAGAWRKGVDKETLTRQIEAALTQGFPGVEFSFSQYIEDNVAEAASGVKGQNSVKLFGPDLATLEATARKIRETMRDVPGIEDLSVLQALGQPTLDVTVDRRRAARLGLNTGDVTQTLQAAVGGQTVGNLYEPGSDRNFPIVVRLAPADRATPEAIGRVTVGVAQPGGGVAQVPLADLADIRLVSGASFIYRENQERYIPIKFSVRGRDLGGAVLDAQAKVGREVALPPGYRLEWVGEFGDLQEALERLALVVPLALALIIVLLYVNFSSLTDTLLAASVMPMALVGGVYALALTGTPFSVSAAIGFIGLFGISVMEGIIVLSYFNQLLEDGLARRDALVRACQTRLRPVMMTCIAACVGLLPAAVSSGIGSQVQKPLALVVVGGILLAPVLILIVLPVLIDLFSRRRPAPAVPA